MSGFFSEPNDYPPRQAEMEEKIRRGNFWGEGGAIADANELACLSLCRLNISGALSLMIDVHGRAHEYLRDDAKWMEASFGKQSLPARISRKRYKKEARTVFLYTAIWKTLSVLSRITA